MPTIVSTSVVLLMSFSGLLALLPCIKVAGIDPLTAYLATSPGGLRIRSRSSPPPAMSISPFVMALQTARLLIITLIGPALARFVADRA